MNRRELMQTLLGGVMGGSVAYTMGSCSKPAVEPAVAPQGWTPPPKHPSYFTSSHTWYLTDWPGRPL